MSEIMTAKNLCLWYGENKALKLFHKATVKVLSVWVQVNGV